MYALAAGEAINVFPHSMGLGLACHQQLAPYSVSLTAHRVNKPNWLDLTTWGVSTV